MYESFPDLDRNNADIGAQLQFNFNTITANFGDGYEQRSANGINSVRETVDVTYSLLSDSDMSIVLNFIKSVGSSKPFYFTFYNNDPKLYTCESFSQTVVEKNRNTIAMQFREWFA
ncbi:phage tail protein [Vreelandella titanicae]|uniref:Phage tail protein n=1 Tax=Vreelandella titanicae TaxID=664683 RepID=A0AAP9T1K9_9GAMM|nr:phage tail protein [Halomonas titanicae]QKS24591.1 hypothetical protein FX987_02373 [Halomonas titanicae]